ncbi:hypothetical protein ABEB36_004403 [Hypothenemus hampei]|uniref:Uncharacterized protein n=1 Tax=Hypothenemus hampei TaxID=57062 RepID=A0ABD1F384_HYPHA
MTTEPDIVKPASIAARSLQDPSWWQENTSFIRNVSVVAPVVPSLEMVTLMPWLKDQNFIVDNKTAGFPFARKPHSIRLVEIPVGQKGIKLSKDVKLSGNNQCFTISELDVNNDLMSLYIGDKILEINRMPVRDAPLEKRGKSP